MTLYPSPLSTQMINLTGAALVKFIITHAVEIITIMGLGVFAMPWLIANPEKVKKFFCG